MGVDRLLANAVRGYLPPGSGVLFSPRTRRRLVWVLVGSVVLSGIEMVGMFLLLLLMQQLTTQKADLGLVALMLRPLGDLSGQQLLAVLSVAVLLVFSLKTGLGMAFRRWVLGYVGAQQAETAHRLLAGYLSGPYQRVVSKNTAYFIRTMYDGASSVYGQVVAPMIQSAVELFTVVALLVFLLVVMPIPALVAFSFFGLAVWILSAAVKTHAIRAGETLVSEGVIAYRTTLHAIGGIKEIKVRNTQSHFEEEFRRARHESARAGATSVFLAEVPKFVMEWLFIVVTLLIVAILGVTSEPSESLPLMAVFVAAGIRLLPSASRLVASANTIRTGLPQMESVVADLVADLPAATEASSPIAPSHLEPIAIRDSLSVVNLRFTYPDAVDPVIDGVSFKLSAGKSLAITGPSGSGKSTLVDVILGLQDPDSGEVSVDGVPVHRDISRWQRSIGLVPQDVFLLDDTLRNNVTLGLPSDDADEDVMNALRLAHLEEMVAGMPEGLNTPLGERGSRVSGGQRQRIGIARALYVKPSLLVLDEATSALDNETESRIGATLSDLRGRVTTIIVAHRLSTVRTCDEVIFLDQGRVAASGTFDEVIELNETFARLVELGRL